jgi:hypothetical protein
MCEQIYYLLTILFKTQCVVMVSAKFFSGLVYLNVHQKVRAILILLCFHLK